MIRYSVFAALAWAQLLSYGTGRTKPPSAEPSLPNGRPSISERLQELTGLPVSLLNDAAACQAEHSFGRGKEFRDYAYFFIGAYIGGGIVLDHTVYEGRQGNAGALGSLRSIGPTRKDEARRNGIN